MSVEPPLAFCTRCHWQEGKDFPEDEARAEKLAHQIDRMFSVCDDSASLDYEGAVWAIMAAFSAVRKEKKAEKEVEPVEVFQPRRVIIVSPEAIPAIEMAEVSDPKSFESGKRKRRARKKAEKAGKP